MHIYMFMFCIINREIMNLIMGFRFIYYFNHFSIILIVHFNLMSFIIFFKYIIFIIFNIINI